MNLTVKLTCATLMVAIGFPISAVTKINGNHYKSKLITISITKPLDKLDIEFSNLSDSYTPIIGNEKIINYLGFEEKINKKKVKYIYHFRAVSQGKTTINIYNKVFNIKVIV